MKDDRLYLEHIQVSVTHIEEFTKDGKSAFLESILVQSAVLRMLQVLTESSQHISDNVKTNYPNIDWRGMSGLRNVVAHDYLNINLTIIWNIIENDLPNLKTEITAILQQMEST